VLRGRRPRAVRSAATTSSDRSGLRTRRGRGRPAPRAQAPRAVVASGPEPPIPLEAGKESRRRSPCATRTAITAPFADHLPSRRGSSSECRCSCRSMGRVDDDEARDQHGAATRTPRARAAVKDVRHDVGARQPEGHGKRGQDDGRATAYQAATNSAATSAAARSQPPHAVVQKVGACLARRRADRCRHVSTLITRSGCGVARRRR